MARSQIVLTVRVKWWVRPYLAGVELMCALTGLEPDLDKVAETVMRGIVAKVD